MDAVGEQQPDGRQQLPVPGWPVRMVFQPVVELAGGAVAGYEALARGPGGGSELPEALFAAARARGRVQELDWACRWAAVAAARDAGFRHPLSLFINAEPDALAGPPGGGIEAWRQMGDLRCYAEITERALADRPGQLLRLADAIRAQDWGIAMDDIGATPQTVALMPMLRPDVLKLDLRLLRDQQDDEVTQILHAVLAQAADTGAAVVAGGIETKRQRDLAAGLGIRLGQGFGLGRPGPLPQPMPQPLDPLGLLARLNDRAVAPAPYTTLNDALAARRVARTTVEAIWAQLEAQAAAVQPQPVVLASFPDRAAYRAGASRLADLSGRLPLVAAFGPPQAISQDVGLRTQALAEGDPAYDDWNLIVLSPHYAAALTARRLPDMPAAARPGSGAGEYELVTCFSRELVVRAASALLTRLDTPPGQPTWLNG